MALGVSRALIEGDLEVALKANSLNEEQARRVAQAIAEAIDKNNREIERELGRRFADIERKIGRA
jgi:protein-disulfide isomerase-like protein with CxxC motif